MQNYNLTHRFLIIITIFISTSCMTTAEETVIYKQIVELEDKPLGPLNSTIKFSSLEVNKYQEAELPKYQELIHKNLVVKVSDKSLHKQIAEGLIKVATTHQINPLFLLAIAEVTSKYKPNFEEANRFGFIPLSLAKVQYISKLYNLPFSDLSELKNLATNIEFSGAYFAFVSELYPNNYEHYLLAYSWNAEALSLFLKGRGVLPKEHKSLLEKVATVYKSYFQEDQAKLALKPHSDTQLTDIETKKLAVKDNLTSESTKALPKYYLAEKSTASSNEYYKKLLTLSLREKLNLNDPQQTLTEIVTQSLKAGFDPVFVFSFIKNSSKFNYQQELNNKYGLLQVSEEDGKLAAKLLDQKWTGKASLLIPKRNLELGLEYLKVCHNIFDNNSLHAIAGYRWGIKNLITALKNKSEIPPLIIRYPQKILEDYQSYLAQSELPDKINNQASTLNKNVNLEPDSLQKIICQSTKDLDLCAKLTNLINKEAGYYQVPPIILAKYAQLQSNFKVNLQVDNRFGLFQWTENEAEKISEYAKVAWAGPRELLKPEYSIKIAAKYYHYLNQRFKGDKKHIAIGLFWDADLLVKAIKSKGIIPNEVNSKATQLLQ